MGVDFPAARSGFPGINRAVNRRLCYTIGAFAVSLATLRGANAVVNLSHYDEMAPDFGRMSKEGIHAAIHEATYPRFATDEKYAARQSQAARAGLLWGAYHFADATDPVKQADHFLGVVESRWRQSPVKPPGVLLVLDYEKNGHYPGGTMSPKQAVAFVERIRERTGRYPGLYASEYRIRDVLNTSSVDSAIHNALSKCWLWVANYHHQPKTTKPWDGWTMWQYTGDGVCDLPRAMFPISAVNIRKAERNVFSGSVGSLKSFWSSNAWVPGR